jgi:hypothetical protein
MHVISWRGAEGAMLNEQALPFCNSENVMREGVDHSFNAADEIAHLWVRRLSREKMSLSERYLKGEMRVCVVFGLVEGSTREFVAEFECFSALDERRSWREFWRKPFGVDVVHTNEARRDGDNCSVLIYDVDKPELEQIVTLASTVRLQRANDFFRIKPDSLKESLGFRVGKIVRPPYREIGFTHYIFRNRDNPGSLNETNRERIQRRHEIVRNVPDDCTDFIGDWFLQVKSSDFNSGLRVLINKNNLVAIATSECINKVLKLRKVFIRAVDFYPTTKKRILGHGENLKGDGINQGIDGRAIA